MKYISGLALAVILLLAVFWRSNQLSLSWQRNVFALGTQSNCIQPSLASEKISQLEGFAQASDDAWFEAINTLCDGYSEGHKKALQAAIAGYPERIFIVKTFLPHDQELAQYAVQTHPDNAQAQFWLGDILIEQNDTQGGITAYQNGLQHQPGDGLSWMKLGRLQEAQGDWESAAESYSQACFYVDGGKNGCPNAGRLYMEHGLYELAADRFKRSTAQLPGWLPARLGLAKALIGMHRIDEAIPILTELAEQGNQEAAEILLTLGVGKE